MSTTSSVLTRGVDVVPLSQRVAAMMVVRVGLTALITAVALLTGVADHLGRPLVLGVVAGYLAASTVLSLLALARRRRWAIQLFGLSLLLDGVLLQLQHEVLGHRFATDSAIATYLVAVCLLASFRSGLKIAVWQSFLMVAAVRAQESGVAPTPPWSADPLRELLLAIDIVLIWATVVTASAAAAINERELRRRRYDAEALHRFAMAAQTDNNPGKVAERLVQFTIEELNATRALVCRRDAAGWVQLSGWGLPAEQDAPALPVAAPTAPPGPTAPTAPTAPMASTVLPAQPIASIPAQATRATACAGADAGVGAGAGASAATAGPGLLDLPPGPEREVLSLRLRPDRDPWLAARLPEARRVICLALQDADGSGAEGGDHWLVFEHGTRRGSRVERRVVTTAAQAAATAALALSRARLLEQAERRASTDGLTGVANRRIFDQLLAELVEHHLATGDSFALVMTDVDKFKSINDTYGHQTGDQVLQQVARILIAGCGPGATPARYGGEEFAVLIRGAQADQAAGTAEQLRAALETAGGPVPVTASFGVAAFPADARDVEELIWKADAALMHAKQTGRNRVVRADAMQPEELKAGH